jgi:hypothetical protein
MIKYLFLIIFCFSNLVYAHVLIKSNIGLSYFNSKDLNAITKGLDAGYGTSFDTFNMSVNYSLVLNVEFEKLELGVFGGYSNLGGSSLSSVYGFTETIAIYNVPFGVNVAYLLWQRSNLMDLRILLKLGTGYTNFSLKTSNISADKINEGLSAWGLYSDLGLEFNYLLGRRWYANTMFAVEYFKTGNLGSNLTLNFSGVQLLLGIKYAWGNYE